MPLTITLKAKEALARIVRDSNADVLLFNSPIERPCDEKFIQQCHERASRPNLILLLVTEGGDADAAYRIARCIQRRYENFSCFVSGYCKSAGTILMLGANDLIFSEYGEIGPLDVQLAKKDDLFEEESGLTLMSAINALHRNAQEAFDGFFSSVTEKSSGRITVRTASEIATKLTEGLYSPISQQIQPSHLGEVYRSIEIAWAYGTRLMRKSRNFNRETLDYLINNYPCHGFVIDMEEASEKFRHVRACTEDERILMDELGESAHSPQKAPVIQYISETVIAGQHSASTKATQSVKHKGDAEVPEQMRGNIPTNGEHVSDARSRRKRSI
jgi:hypothetical protein